MATLQLQQPVVVLTLGYPGSGKSFFCRGLAAKTSIMVISENRVRYELFEKPTYSKEENSVVNRIIDYMLELFLMKGMSVAIDANHGSKKRRKEVYELAEQYKAYPLIVWIQTDLETAKDRATHRDRRAIDDRYTAQLTKDQFEKMRSAIDKPNREEYVVLSGKHVFKNQYSVMRQKLLQLGIATLSTAPQQSPGRVNDKRRSN